MDQDQKLDFDIDSFDIEIKLKKDKKKYALRILGLIVFNILIFGLFIEEPEGIAYRFGIATYTYLIGMNLIGFFLGIFAALFPYKKLSFGKKYLRVSLITIYILQLLFLVFGLLNILLRFMGFV